MKVTETTRRILAYRREQARLLGDGYEAISENGHPLWQLHRGARTHHRITDVVIGVDGRTLYMKTAPAQTA
jgi:hypothetical protein